MRALVAEAGGKLQSPSLEFGEDSDSRLIENMLASVAQHQREKNTEQVIEMLTSNEEFMTKVKSYQKQREALLKLQSAFRTRKMQLWLRQAVAVRQCR